MSEAAWGGDPGKITEEGIFKSIIRIDEVVIVVECQP